MGRPISLMFETKVGTPVVVELRGKEEERVKVYARITRHPDWATVIEGTSAVINAITPGGTELSSGLCGVYPATGDDLRKLEYWEDVQRKNHKRLYGGKLERKFYR